MTVASATVDVVDCVNTHLVLPCHLFINPERKNSLLPNSSRFARSKVPTFLSESWGIINLSPHISPTTAVQICCKVPTKSPVPPRMAWAPLLGEADDKWRTLPHILPLFQAMGGERRAGVGVGALKQVLLQNSFLFYYYYYYNHGWNGERMPDVS